MSLKEKMAFIMAIILAINLVPFNVQKAFASVQSHKGDDVVKYTGEPIYYYNEKPYYNEEDVHRPSVKIYPTDEIQYNETNPSGNSIFITIENAKFDFEYYHIPDYKAYLDEYNGNDYYYNYEGRIFSYNELFDNLSQNAQNVVDDQTKEQAVIDAYSEMQNSICSELPWFIKIISDTQIQVFLAPVPKSAAGKSGIITPDKPYYLLTPLYSTYTGHYDDIKINVNINGLPLDIEENDFFDTVYVNNPINNEISDRNTTATVEKEVKSAEILHIKNITVKETKSGNFNAIKNNDGTYSSANVVLKLNEGFVFDNNSPYIETGSNLSGYRTYGNVSDDGKEIVFKLPVEWIANEYDENNNVIQVGTKYAGSFVISDLYVIEEDYDSPGGDVYITISGEEAGISTQTIKVGELLRYGIALETVGTVPEIISGKTSVSANTQTTETNFKSMIIEVKEVARDSWLSSRPFVLSVPNGVEIESFECIWAENIYDNSMGIINRAAVEGKTAILSNKKSIRVSGLSNNYSGNNYDGMEFDIVLELSVDEDFVGDIVLSAQGAGFSKDEINDVVIAKVIKATEADAKSILKHISGIETLSSDQLLKADVNNDKKTDMLDVILLLNN